MEPTRLLNEVLAELPGTPAAEAFRLAMLLCHAAPSVDALADDQLRSRLLADIQLQISMHEDQHAAIAAELDSLASTEPCDFSVNHLWTLIRAIKVQSQLLNFYLGPAVTAEV